MLSVFKFQPLICELSSTVSPRFKDFAVLFGSALLVCQLVSSLGFGQWSIPWFHLQNLLGVFWVQTMHMQLGSKPRNLQMYIVAFLSSFLYIISFVFSGSLGLPFIYSALIQFCHYCIHIYSQTAGGLSLRQY